MKEKDQQSLIDSAKKNFNKADRYYEIKNFKKAAKLFVKSGEELKQAEQYKAAEEALVRASKAFGFINDYDNMAEYQRQAADVCIMLNDISKARRYFKLASKYALMGKEDKNRDFVAIVTACFSYLCLFLLGRQDEGINYLKSAKRQVDGFTFKENLLVQLIKNITIAIRDRKENYLKVIEEDFEKFKFRPSEGILIKYALVLAKSHILMETKFNFKRKEYTSDEKIEFSLHINTEKLVDISESKFLDYKIEKISFINMGVAQSDNLSVIKKPKLPIELRSGGKTTCELISVPNYPDLNSFIGPILLTCQINDFLTFFVKTKVNTIKISSPPPQLGVFFKQLKPPIINQSFPLEITVSNKSTGEAVEVEINLDFPEELKVMRGTTQKQIYSIRSGEEIKWEVQVKPLEPGDFSITTNVKYKDGDGNLTDKTKDFPMLIKL